MRYRYIMSAARFIPTFYLTHLNNGGVNLNFVNDLFFISLILGFRGIYLYICQQSSALIE